MEESDVYFSSETERQILSSTNPPKAAVSYLANLKKHYDWVGIYVLCGDELHLGPFVGQPTPHIVIPISKGICGAAVREERTINLPDVWSDDRFIACSTTTRSELVVPIWHENKIVGQIDIDSNMPAAFSKADEVIVENITKLIGPHVQKLYEELENKCSKE